MTSRISTRRKEGRHEVEGRLVSPPPPPPLVKPTCSHFTSLLTTATTATLRSACYLLPQTESTILDYCWVVFQILRIVSHDSFEKNWFPTNRRIDFWPRTDCFASKMRKIINFWFLGVDPALYWTHKTTTQAIVRRVIIHRGTRYHEAINPQEGYEWQTAL